MAAISTPRAQVGYVAPVHLDRDGSAFIVAVSGDITGMLGWAPDDLIGRPSTEFLHPADQPSAVQAWMQMIERPGEPVRWRGRYRHRDGEWVWVEAINTNLLADPENPCVRSTMRAVERGDLSVEERLRAREQLLTRLADALPVGIVHFDPTGEVVATNGRLEAILGRGGCSTLDDVFAPVSETDRVVLTDALRTTITDQHGTDGLEIGLRRTEDAVVCSISTRALTDAGGAVTGAIATVEDVTERVRLREQLHRRATTDALTSCLNRRAILDELGVMIARIGRESTGVAVVFVDLDGFKAVNDTHGHAVGDLLLVHVADLLRATVRDGDRVGRVGGDEFLVACPGIARLDRAHDLAARIDAALDAEVDLGAPHGPISVGASVGVGHSAVVVEAAELVARADHEMYRVKDERRPGAGVRRS
ncbi:diguanylate cyclase [Ilumatobacter sp.]|uniref:diguanylate cyclase n=1 Tax=Ilumatobacter sp. TaxID=1967498 RepID=UPI003B5194CD